MRKSLDLAVFPLLVSLVTLWCAGGCTDGTEKEKPEAPEVVATEPSPGPGGDELIIHLILPITSLNPFTYRFAPERWVLEYLRSPLYILDKRTMKVKPELAVKLPEKSADKLVWTIRLRPDARWHDGTPVTTRDIEASFKLLKDPAVNAQKLRSHFDKLTEVQVVDEHTFRFVYSEPYYFALEALTYFPVVPVHEIDKLEKPGDWNDVKEVTGCGPYKLELWKDDKVVLVRNEEWFGEKPNLKRITYWTILNVQAAISSLERGEIDAMGIPFDQWRLNVSKKKKLLEDFHQLSYHRPVFWYLAWNGSKSMFSDKRTRKALTMLLDIPAQIRTNWFPGSQQITGPFYFKGPQYDLEIKPLPHDRRKAQELLREVGWKDTDGDGILDRGGEKFEFTLLLTRGPSVFENVAAAVEHECRGVGIQVTLKRLDQKTLNDLLFKNEYDGVLGGLSWPGPEIDPYQMWHSDQIGGLGYNRAHFRNAEADHLIEEARVEFDDAKRQALYRRLHRIIYEEQPFTFLFTPQFKFLVDKRFRNVESFDVGMTPRIGIEWWVPPGEEKRKR